MTASRGRSRSGRAPGWRGLALVLGVSSAVLGCVRSGPSLERWDDSRSEWVDLGPVLVESVRGVRDGANVRATAVITHSDDRWTLTFSLFLEPPARFVSGRQESVIGGVPTSGALEADAIDFLGGQSTASSVGGVFRMVGPNGDRYRIRIPATLMSAAGPEPRARILPRSRHNRERHPDRSS